MPLCDVLSRMVLSSNSLAAWMMLLWAIIRASIAGLRGTSCSDFVSNSRRWP